MNKETIKKKGLELKEALNIIKAKTLDTDDLFTVFQTLFFQKQDSNLCRDAMFIVFYVAHNAGWENNYNHQLLYEAIDKIEQRIHELREEFTK